LKGDALRRLCAAALTLVLPACANIQAPTGGPVDSIAPRLIATRPDTSAVLANWAGSAVFVFDEGLSEEGVTEAVTLSPRRGPVAVDKEGDELRVRPRRGWETGLIYQIEVAPGIKDRFNNVIRIPHRLVFSTGPAIPATRATGVVTDRVRGEPSALARVDAMRLSDSLTYSTLADSAGRYAFAQVPEGAYRVIGYRDTNRNFRVDSYEQRDTVMVTLVAGQAPEADLALVPNDTTAPVAGSARMTDGWVEVRFDDYLDPDQPLQPSQVVLLGPDSAAVVIAEVRVGPPPAAQDSGAALDSARAAADSLRPARPAGGVRPARPDSARADTAGADSARPRGPLPSQSLFARPQAPLLPDTLHTVRVTGVRNVNGLVGGGEAPLRTPRPPPPRPPRDSAAAAKDSAAADAADGDSVDADSVAAEPAAAAEDGVEGDSVAPPAPPVPSSTPPAAAPARAPAPTGGTPPRPKTGERPAAVPPRPRG
jgi:hypothetical protein